MKCSASEKYHDLNGGLICMHISDTMYEVIFYVIMMFGGIIAMLYY